MKTINTYINEKLRLTTKRTYTCQPKDKNELRNIIRDRIKKEGNECDLNDIDTSKIKDMSYLFDIAFNKIFKDFNGDMSMWDVSNVEDMDWMFCKCTKFNCDLSKWNVSNVKRMESMFRECDAFNADLSKWKTPNLETTSYMFYLCKQFNCDLSRWDVSKVKNMNYMFSCCFNFDQDIDSWDVSNVEYMYNAFKDCPTRPKWYNNSY